MKPTDFKPGERVYYLPIHAQGMLSHPDVEEGIVTSINDTYVFVAGWGKSRGKACDPNSLVHHVTVGSE